MDVSPSIGRSEALPKAVEAKSGATRRKRVNIMGDILRICFEFSGQECSDGLTDRMKQIEP